MKFYTAWLVVTSFSALVVWLFLCLIHIEWLAIPSFFDWWLSVDTEPSERFLTLIIIFLLMFFSSVAAVLLQDSIDRRK